LNKYNYRNILAVAIPAAKAFFQAELNLFCNQETTPMQSGTKRHTEPFVTIDRGYLIFAGHAIGGVERPDGRPEPWLIDRPNFDAACAEGLGKAGHAAAWHGATGPWRSAIEIVDHLAKGDHAVAQALADRMDLAIHDRHSRDAIASALKPMAKHVDRHPSLAEIRQKFNPNHDRLGRFASASDSDDGGGETANTAERDGATEHILSNPRSYIGHDVYGSSQCVDLIMHTLGAPRTPEWKQGRPVTRGADIPVGTAIATFVDGHYPSNKTGQHAAIYLSQNETGIDVVEQFVGIDKNKVAFRNIRWSTIDGKLSNRGGAYSTILWKDK
jgi:hypothetical protein